MNPIPTRYGQAAVGMRPGRERPAGQRRPSTAKTAAVAVIITAVVPAASPRPGRPAGASRRGGRGARPTAAPTRTIQTE